MSNVGQLERKTQNRVVNFFKEQLDFDFLDNWQYRAGNSNIEKIYRPKSSKVMELLML